MAIVKFPTHPADGTLFEPAPGVFYRYSAREKSWIRIDTTVVGLATPSVAGMMSKEDFKKLQSIVLPPPQSTLQGEDCDVKFDSGVAALYSTDESIFVEDNLSVGGNLQPWQIHENTAGYNFRLNLEQFIAEIESRGKFKKVQLAGKDGAKGKKGDPGTDNLDTGPEGDKGTAGANSPFPGSFFPESTALQVDDEQGDRAIVDVTTEQVSEDENYLVVTRANIGNPDACPPSIAPRNFDSPWVLVLDQKEANVTRRLEATGDCAITCRICVSQVYYLNIENIIETVQERFEAKLYELKFEKEKVVNHWLKVMSSLFNEQKYALCCALENCTTRKRNQDVRRYIEQSRIQAAIGEQRLIISSGEDDKITVPSDQKCDLDEDHGESAGGTDSRVVYGQECDQFLVTMSLDARIHNKDPRTGSNGRWLVARLPPGDYMVEELDCCANFGRKVQPRPQVKRLPPPTPPPPPAPPPQTRQATQFVAPPRPQVTLPARNQYVGTLNIGGGKTEDLYVSRPATTLQADPPMPTAQAQSTQYNTSGGNAPGRLPFGFSGPGGSVPAGLRVPFSNTTAGRMTADEIAAKRARGECVLELSGQVGNQPGDIPSKGYTGYILDDCTIAHGFAHSSKVNGCIPICQDNNKPDVVTDNNLRFPNKYTGRVAIQHYGLMPGQATDSEIPVEKVTEIPAVGPSGGFFTDLFAARSAYIGLSTIFNHAGGNIKVWIPDPDNISANNDGGIVIGIRSRRCIEEDSSDGTSGATTQLPTIYIYRDKLDPKTLVGSIKPYVTDLSHVANYGDGTPTTGPALEPEVSKAFFVMASDGLAFYHIHHTNEESAPDFTSTILSKYKVESNSQTVGVEVSDDEGDVAALESDGQVFEAAWTFEDETAGVVLNNFDSDVRDDWILTLDEASFGNIKKLMATGVDGEELVLSQGSLDTIVPAQSIAEPFILCRALIRSCNVPAALNKRYSIGVVNRVLGVNFRICRNLPEWNLDSWIRRPFIYAPAPHPCGSSFCDVKYQVINGSDGQVVPLNTDGDHRVHIDGTKVNIAFVVDQTTSMAYEYTYLASKVDDLANFILAGSVEHLAMSLVTFGGQENSGDPILRQDFTDSLDAIAEAINDNAPPTLGAYASETSPGLWATQWTVDNVAWEDDAVKIIVLITDKNSSATPGVSPETVTEALKRKMIILNGIVKLSTESVSGSTSGPRPFDTLLCESWSYRYAECSASKKISEAWVIDKHSRSACNKTNGESPTGTLGGFLGYNLGTFGITGDGKLWTDHGCRATFGIRYKDDVAHSEPINTNYGTPRDIANPSAGGVGLCYDNGGTLFSIQDLRDANLDNEVLVAGQQTAVHHWDNQPFRNLRVGTGSNMGNNTSPSTPKGLPGFPMPFDLDAQTAESLRSNQYHMAIGKFEGGLPPHNPPIKGGLVHLKSNITGDKVIASTITDDSGRYAFIIPVGFFPRYSVELYAELHMFPFRTGNQWTIRPAIKDSGHDQAFAYQIGSGPELLRYFNNAGDLPNGVVHVGSASTIPDNRFSIRGLVSVRGNLYTSYLQRLSYPRIQGGMFMLNFDLDDTGVDLDFNDLIVVLEHPITDCMGTGGMIEPITKITQRVVVDDQSHVYYGPQNRILQNLFGSTGTAGTASITNNDGLQGFTAGTSGNGVSSFGIRGFTPDEVNKLNTAMRACTPGGFLQKFADIKLKEIQAFAPKIDASCTEIVNGGPSTVYKTVAGIKMNQATLDGTIQAVQATITALPGTAIRAAIYDKQGRGIIMRSIATLPTQSWETRSWQVDNIDRYVNPDANTVDAATSLANQQAQATQITGSRNQPFTYAFAKGSGTFDLLQSGDARQSSPEGRTQLLTQGFSLKLQDLATVAFEFINPDTGTICFFASVKVAVERVKNHITGETEVVMVDIANFEPFGESVDEPGEIPLTVYAGAVESSSGTETNPGAFATATMILTANPIDGDRILLGGTNREGTVIHGGSQVITFKTTLITDHSVSGYPGHQVKIGATPAETLENLCNLINGIGLHNDTWHNALTALGFPIVGFAENSFFECSGVVGETITFQSTIVGIGGNASQAREVLDQTAAIHFGASVGSPVSTTFSGGINPVESQVLVTTLATTEDDVSAYLENFWSIAMPDTVLDPNACRRWKELCPDCVVVKCDRTDINSVLRQDISCIDKTVEMHVPLTKYLFTPIAPCESCMMHWKQVEWYERGWRIGACCGAFVEVEGQQWIVVKRSIGIDTSCGGGESEHTECIRQFVESGRGHPAIAWPSVDGEEFIGRPHSGFVRFSLDPVISDAIINAISKQNYKAIRGNLAAGNVADTIPFILFPRLG